jgi:organic hydroperoxide reductase OsmC/OhrA
VVLETRLLAFPFSSELVWNAGLSATGSAGGRSLTAGFEGDWAPEHLLLLAVESCFMSTFLSLAYAAGLDVLGYVSSARLEQPPHQTAAPVVSLTPCIVVGSATDATFAREFAGEAGRESIVSRLLGPKLRINPDIRIVAARSE